MSRVDGAGRPTRWWAVPCLVVLLSALTGPNLHVKIAIAVDEDVDIYNAEEVLWAIACRCDPQTMTHMLPGSRPGPHTKSLRILDGVRWTRSRPKRRSHRWRR